MTVLLQISDLHFGTEQPLVMDALRRLVKSQHPDVLVVSGDITQRARPSQFMAARLFCDSLAINHMLCIPGNHDIPLFNVFERLLSPYRHYLKAFGPAPETCLDLPAMRVMGVKTTRRWRHKNGEVSTGQINRVVALLKDASPEQLCIVVVHQPVQVIRSEDTRHRLRGADAALKAWASAGADIVMGGHLHLPYVCELSNSNSLGRRMWCVQAGTGLSSRVRWEAPNSVNLLRYSAGSSIVKTPGNCRVERWDYSAESHGFTLVKTDSMSLDLRPLEA